MFAMCALALGAGALRTCMGARVRWFGTTRTRYLRKGGEIWLPGVAGDEGPASVVTEVITSEGN